jgi:hypothetical protein
MPLPVIRLESSAVVSWMVSWIRKRWIWLAAYALLGAAIGLAGNTYIIAIAGGYSDVKPDSVALMPNRFWRGAVFWFGLSALVFGIFAFLRARGIGRLAGVARTLRQRISFPFKSAPMPNFGIFLLGFSSVFWWLPYFVIPITALVAIALVVIAMSRVPVYAGAYAGRGIALVLGPKRISGESLWRGFAAFLLGLALAHALIVLIAWGTSKVWYSAMAAAVAIACIVWRNPARKALLWAGIACCAAIELEFLRAALADDGGFYENSTLASWWSDRGSGHVIGISTPAAPIGAVGGVTGGLIGEGLGERPDDEDDEDLARKLDLELFGEPVTPAPATTTPGGSSGPRTIDLPLGEPDGTTR